MGAMFGTASYVWIVLGSIFAGAVHDYLSGMLSLRNSGESLPELIGRYLGLPTKQVMRVFSVILMMLVGAVFVASPADLLARLTPESLDMTFWIVVIFIYYILATVFFRQISQAIVEPRPLLCMEGRPCWRRCLPSMHSRCLPSAPAAVHGRQAPAPTGPASRSGHKRRKGSSRPCRPGFCRRKECP